PIARLARQWRFLFWRPHLLVLKTLTAHLRHWDWREFFRAYHEEAFRSSGECLSRTVHSCFRQYYNATEVPTQQRAKKGIPLKSLCLIARPHARIASKSLQAGIPLWVFCLTLWWHIGASFVYII